MFINKIRDYLILYKFRVWTLLIYAGILSYLIAIKYGYSFDSIKLLSLFFAGTFSIMGNGAVNEYLEIEYDKLMIRTKNRPLVTGSISPKFALYSGIILLIMSIMISFFLINILTTFFIVLATIIYFVYTKYLKRTTWTNVLVGGFAGSCTAWAGWSAATNNLNMMGFLLGLLIYFWTNPHFWALALRLKDDYNSAGYKMLTSMLNEKSAARVIAISSLPLPLVTLLIAYFGKLSLIFWAFSIILNFAFILFTIFIYIKPTRGNSWLLFKFSTPWLAIIFLLILLDLSKYSIYYLFTV